MTQANEPCQRVCQGDVIRAVDCYERVSLADGAADLRFVTFPLVIVLTQDCDLKWDHDVRHRGKETQDIRLISALVAPVYNAELVYRGQHLDELEIKARTIDRTRSEGRFIENNQNPRYHYLTFPEPTDIVPSIVDFKHYFSAHITYLEERKRDGFAAALLPFHREDISQRFAAFLARIAVPT